MSRTIHVGLSVSGALRSKEWRTLPMYDKTTRRRLTPDEAFDALCDLLEDGVEMIPIDEPCDGWDSKTGCPGHDDKKEIE